LIATRAGLRVWVATQPIDFRRGVHAVNVKQVAARVL
jgi:hypothetical protein